MPKKLSNQTSLGLPLPPRAGAEEAVALRAAKPSEKSKKVPVNRMRQRIRKLPPTHYTLYRSAVSLLEYTYRLIEKFPKSEKLALAHDIRRRTEDVVELVLEAVSFYSKDKNREALLRKNILHLAVSGQLVSQDSAEGTGEEVYKEIQAEKANLVRAGELKPQKTLPLITEAEIPFQIPQSWKWVRLADATIFSICRTPSRSESAFWSDTYMPWVSIADLKAGVHIADTKEQISKKAFDKCFGGQAVPAGSLLYSFKLTIGKMSIIDMDAVHNEAIASFRTLSPEMTDYLFKALEAIDPMSRSNGAIMGKTLNSASLSLLEIPLPPLAEQIRIVKKTTQLLDLLTQLEQRLEK